MSFTEEIISKRQAEINGWVSTQPFCHSKFFILVRPKVIL